MLWLYKRVIFGNLSNNDLKGLVDLKNSEIVVLWSLAIPIIFFGFYPDPLLNTVETSVENLINIYNSSINAN